MMRRFFAVILLTALANLVGCGGGGGPEPAVVPPPADPLPSPEASDVQTVKKRIDLAP